MKVIILTTSAYGTTGHHLPILHQCKNIEIAMVVVSDGQVINQKKQRSRKIKKMLRIGVFGAVNGIRMRKWYREGMHKYCRIENAETFCAQHNIPFKRVPHTNSKETQEFFKASGADLGLSLGNGYIGKRVFSIPRYGMLNIHHEILPEYQNAQSIIWQLYNGSAETGYTIHKIDQHIDKGDIIYQETLPIVFRETLGETVAYNYAQLFDASAQGMSRVLDNFDQYYTKAQQQRPGHSYTTPSLWQFMRIRNQFNKLKKAATGK
jgi:methionyl-tRNA formyltransferase